MPEVLYQEITKAMVFIKVTPEVMRQRDEKVADGICLVCDEPLDTIPGSPRRGCCARCYQAILRGKQRGKTDEKRLVKEGRILPATESRKGRPPKIKKVRDIIEG